MLTTNSMKCSLVTFLAFILFFALCGASIAEKRTVLRFGDESRPEDPKYKAHARFVDLVKERTNGRIVVEHYGSGTMGAGIKLNETFMVGGVDIATSSNTNIGRFSKSVHFLDLPYLFGSWEEQIKFNKCDLAKEIFGEMQKDMKCKILMAMPGGHRNLIHTAGKPIRLPEDLKGMKIRSTGAKPEVGVLKAWGARPTPIDWGEVYTALQQGVAEGSYNAYMLHYANKFYEVCKDITEIKGSWVTEITFISLRALNKLSKEDQEILLEAAEEAENLGIYLAQKLNQYGREQIIKKGVRVYIPTAEEEQIWRMKAMESWDDLIAPKTSIPPSLVAKVMRSLQ